MEWRSIFATQRSTRMEGRSILPAGHIGTALLLLRVLLLLLLVRGEDALQLEKHLRGAGGEGRIVVVHAIAVFRE